MATLELPRQPVVTMTLRVNGLFLYASVPKFDFGEIERDQLEVIRHLQGSIAVEIARRLKPEYFLREFDPLSGQPASVRQHEWRIMLNGEPAHWHTWLEYPARSNELVATAEHARRALARLIVEEIKEPRIEELNSIPLTCSGGPVGRKPWIGPEVEVST